MTTHSDNKENVPATKYKTEVTDAPSVSERTKAEQQAGVEAAKAQAQSQQRAQYEAKQAADPNVDTYVEPPPLNSEADVTDVGKIAEEMNKQHEEEDRRDAQRGVPTGLNPGEVASRGFAPTGSPATGTYPDNAPVSDEKRLPKKEGQAADKRTYAKEKDKDKE